MEGCEGCRFALGPFAGHFGPACRISHYRHGGMGLRAGVTTHRRWHNRPMEPGGENELALYALVADRLKRAHAQVRALDVPEEASQALTRKLLGITAVAKHDLAGAARRLDRLMADLESGSAQDPGTL